jgi:hypothetical protein
MSYLNRSIKQILRINQIRFRLLLIAFLGMRICAAGQSSEEVKAIFTQAESYFIYEEYELANQLYLLIDNPENRNVKYKIGVCYLNIPGEKEKSIPFLEEAVKTVDSNANTTSVKETRAPIDSYFFLAKAYMINNEFEKGLNTFRIFEKLSEETGSKAELENYQFVSQQIKACENAIRFRQVPVSYAKEKLGPAFSMGSLNENPAVSYDGNTIVYTERRGLENALFCSRKVGDKWETPVEITAELHAGTDCSSSSLNYDGTKLFLYKTDNYDGEIYSSDYKNGSWSPIVKLDKNINSKYYESHACISADGKKLYFASNREGGLGSLDIYVSNLDAKGKWGPAENLGPTINTPFNEDNPFITENDSVIFFCSEGHNSMGCYDIFSSRRNGNGWIIPGNLGYPVNSPDDDKFFQPANNGKNAYYSMTTDYKKKEIFYFDLTKPGSGDSYTIAGIMKLSGSEMAGQAIRHIGVINKITGDTLVKVLTPSDSGYYNINVPSGLFRILYSGEGYYSQSVDTMLTENVTNPVIDLNVVLLRDTTMVRIDTPIEKIDISLAPKVAGIDSSILIRNVLVKDDNDRNVKDSEILYYTVQVMALHSPVDVTYFKYITDMKVMYNDDDLFYRYTTGRFETRNEAYGHRSYLLSKGYPAQIFVKKITHQ